MEVFVFFYPKTNKFCIKLKKPPPAHYFLKVIIEPVSGKQKEAYLDICFRCIQVEYISIYSSGIYINIFKWNFLRKILLFTY